ncbi:hypothetical protein ACWDUL_08645 [Nocardia niigatensis]
MVRSLSRPVKRAAGSFELEKIGKRSVELIRLHTVNVQIEALVEGLVEVAPNGIAPVFVQLPRISE